MSDRDDKILSGIASLQTTMNDVKSAVGGLEVKMTDVQITNAVQNNDIDTLKKEIESIKTKVGKAFKKIEDHVAGHMVYYTGTIGIVISILAVARYIGG